MFASLSAAITAWALLVPLPVFLFVGSFLEEVVAPIPAPLILTVGGSIASAQGYGWAALAVLLAVASLGKTIADLALYALGAWLGPIFFVRFGKYIGVSEKDVENVSARFQGGWKDDVLLFVLRALPIVPSAPLSIFCGTLRINLTTFILSTFLGTFVRSGLFMLLGYLGIDAYASLAGGMQSLESFGAVVGVLLVVGALIWSASRAKRSVR